MTEQEKFEAWYRNQYGSFPERSIDDAHVDYLREHHEFAWKGWRAAIASREPMTENEMKQVISETSALARFKYQDFVRAIERFHGIGE